MLCFASRRLVLKFEIVARAFSPFCWECHDPPHIHLAPLSLFCKESFREDFPLEVLPPFLPFCAHCCRDPEFCAVDFKSFLTCWTICHIHFVQSPTRVTTEDEEKSDTVYFGDSAEVCTRCHNLQLLFKFNLAWLYYFPASFVLRHLYHPFLFLRTLHWFDIAL